MKPQDYAKLFRKQGYEAALPINQALFPSIFGSPVEEEEEEGFLENISGDAIKQGLGKGAGRFGAGINAFNMSDDRPNIGLGMLGGLLSGGLLGAGAGLLGAGTKAMNYDQQEFEQTKQMYENAEVPARSFELGGNIGEMLGEEYTPIQAEKGDSGKEVLLMTNGDLVDTNATKSHDEMEDEDITDIVPENSYVFSASDDIAVDLSDVADTVIGLGISSYSENGDNYGGGLVTFGDLFGDEGEHTFAEIGNKIKRMYPTKYENEKDIFNDDTNKDNKTSRVPILQKVISMQEAKRANKETEESAVPQLKYGGLIKKRANGGNSFFDNMITGMRASGQLYNDTFNQEDAPLTFENPEPLMLGNEDYEMTSMSPGYTYTPTEGKSTENNSYDPTDFYSKSQDYLDSIIGGNEGRRDTAKSDYGSFFDRERGRNLLGNTLGIASAFGQSTDVEVPEVGTEFVADMFPVPSQTDVDVAVAPLREGVAQTAAMLEQSGLPASQAISLLSGVQSEAMQKEAEVRENARTQAREQVANKLAAYQQAANKNRGLQAKGRNEERGLQGQQLATGTKSLEQLIQGQGQIDADELRTEREIERTYNNNRINNLLNQMELDGMLARNKMYEQKLSQMENDMKELLR